MNTRKLLLAYLRKGDFAHAGEIEAITLTMAPMVKNPEHALLDVGCGLGGTANYLEKQGLGKVIGIDIDSEMIDYASHHYPAIQFQHCDVLNVPTVLPNKKFDVIYSFNAFFSFPEQEKSLIALSHVAKENSLLALFDYTSPEGYFEKNIFEDHASLAPKIFAPINLSTIKKTLLHTGWQLDQVIDLTPKFETWYQWLIAQMKDKKDYLIQEFGQKTFNDLYEGYCKLLHLIHTNQVGGSIIYANSFS